MEKPTCVKCNELAKLLLEARDALPVISLSSLKLRGIRLDLADRIEQALEPWRIEDVTIQATNKNRPSDN